MWNEIKLYTSDITIIASVFTFLMSFGVLAYSAFKYIVLRRDELKNQRYDKYHSLLRKVSTGSDDTGELKLVSQRAFIYELRHFPEYKVLTKRLLESLIVEWRKNSDRNLDSLEFEIKDTLRKLK